VIYFTRWLFTSQKKCAFPAQVGLLDEAFFKTLETLSFSAFCKALMFSKLFCVGLLPHFILAATASAHAQSFPKSEVGDTELSC
jgi:hypothetical protein